MNCGELQERLADLIGGELDRPTREAAQAHLAGCAACRDRARALGEAAAAFETGIPASEAAIRATAGMELPVSRGQATIVRLPRSATGMMSLLRYAAVILLAFSGGYWAATTRLPATGGVATSAMPSPSLRESTASPIVSANRRSTSLAADGRVVEQFAAAARAYPKSNTLTWSLLSIAKRG